MVKETKMNPLKYRNCLEEIQPYIPGKPIEEVQRELGLTQIIKLASNENPLGSSPRIREAVLKALEQPSYYPDGMGLELRQELAGITGLKIEQIVLGAGSFELIGFVAETFINPGEEALIPSPSFGWYKTVTKLKDGIISEVLLNNHRIDLNKIKENITDKTRVIWLCNPNNPTGTIFTRDELVRFLEEVPKDVVVAIDEAYCDFVTGDGYPDSEKLINTYDNLIVLRTFSKIYGLASLRIGYALTNVKTANYLNRVRQIFNVSAVAQASAVASIKDNDFHRLVYENNSRGKHYLYDEFTKLGLEYIPTEASFVMVKIDRNDLELSQRLLEKGVIIRPGSNFEMAGWLRVSIGTAEENTTFINALRELL